MINRTKGWGLFLLLGILLTCAAHGQEWSRFRGPNGQGISDAKTIPVKWTEKDYNWKVKLPAGGHGSPVLWNDKVFVTCESPVQRCGKNDEMTGTLRMRHCTAWETVRKDSCASIRRPGGNTP